MYNFEKSSEQVNLWLGVLIGLGVIKGLDIKAVLGIVFSNQNEINQVI